MKNDELTFAENCRRSSGGKLVRAAMIPFPHSTEEDDVIDTPCVHSERLVALSQEMDDGEAVGIIAMSAGPAGLLSAYKAKDLRGLAASLCDLADYMDSVNG